MSEAEKEIRRHLAYSCGNGGYPTRHTLRCFVGMVETGEITFDDLRKIGGEWLEEQVREEMKSCST
jgi:hypothetical protein